MREEFIPKKQEKELKEHLGFKKPCVAIDNGDHLFYGEFKHTHEYYKNACILYQQAFEFFSEKLFNAFDSNGVTGPIYKPHKIKFFVCYEKEYLWEWKIVGLYSIPFSMPFFHTKQEAELGLIDKLIELSKEKLVLEEQAELYSEEKKYSEKDIQNILEGFSDNAPGFYIKKNLLERLEGK